MDNIAVVFPGQGSQSVGMLSSYLTAYPAVKQLCQQASNILGYDLHALIEQGPKDQLDQTQYTQPAVFVAAYAIWQVWRSSADDEMPQVLAGHSLGEYTALTCAQSIQFDDALHLVKARAEIMQNAVRADMGAMAAILGLDDNEVIAACRSCADNEIVCAANFNAPGQVVIAGHRTAVLRTIDYIKEKFPKIRVRLLPVSVPSHCPLMEEASRKFAEVLQSIPIKSPKIPVIHNVNVETISHPDDIRQILVKQLYSPVRWQETILAIGSRGIQTVVECGPGNVLSGLNRRIDRTLNTISLAQCENISKLIDMKESQ